ncbi:MAG: murein transglycosylase A [Kiloniellales bacterium]
MDPRRHRQLELIQTGFRRGRTGRRAVVGLGLVALFLTAGCERPPPEPLPDALTLTRVAFNDLPGWREDAVAEALPALRRSCGRLLRAPDERAVGPEALAGTVADWRPACAALDGLPDGDDAALRTSLEAHFEPFLAANNDENEGLFTGYYEAELRGALVPGDGYDVPLYRRPPDLVTAKLGRFRADLAGLSVVGRVEDGALVPYPDRVEIEDGALAGQGLELLWVDDPVDAFFLQVQGSGRVLLPDGSTLRVGFAASNGRTFYAIGRALIEDDKIPRDQVSMQSIRDWLRANPETARAYMRRNPRYIFFRTIEGDGPVGAQGVALTAGRSLAIDPHHLALGLPVWLDTTLPGGGGPLRRLMVAQDTGGAIKGPVRGDFYWGSGEPALARAGGMKERGVYYILLPKSVAERRDSTS